MKRLFNIAMLLALLAPGLSHAWWNADWTQRRKITLNTSASGLELKEALAQAVLPVRLHTGNFSFVDAQEKGADLRFIAADDKTPLKFHIEKFDSLNNLAIVWVQLPTLAPGSAEQSVYLYYGNPKAPAADDAKGSYDVKQAAVLHFAPGAAAPQDMTAYGNTPAAQKVEAAEGLMGAGAKLDGSASLTLPASPSLKLAANGGFTFSAWIKPAEQQADALLLSGKDGDKAIRIGVAGGKLYARLKGGAGVAEGPAAGALDAGKWHHVAVTLKDKLTAYVDGQEVGSTAAVMPDFGGQLIVGAADGQAGFKGEIDELAIATVARSADWIKLNAGSQGADAKLIGFGEDESGESGGGSSYFAILLNSVTVDGWVVIGILMVMALVSFAVMAGKALFVSKMHRANRAFMDQFEHMSGEFMSLDQGDPDDDAKPAKGSEAAKAHLLKHSSLYRIYHTGVLELQRRFKQYEQSGTPRELSGAAIEAIRSSLDTGIVRESQRLNSQIVLLTIAISGGPFLGLLGTVVGVMITFAAIAAAGDVNVNAIAPGIAAALVATVAGLGVAIPSLFGYNYLSSRIKDLTADMQVFTDQLVTRMAESYGA